MNSDDGEVFGDVGMVTSDFEHQSLVRPRVKKVSLDLNRGFDQVGRQKLKRPVAEAKVATLGRMRVDVPGHVARRH